jgi:hypothetical protein
MVQTATQTVHDYPQALAFFLHERWGDPLLLTNWYKGVEFGSADPLPDIPVLEMLLSVCYQASLMREEERGVRFRLMVREPERFVPEHGPPHGLHRLVFDQPRPFNEHELRKLSPAATFYRSLVGVSMNGNKEPQIWGLVHSGPYWIQAIQGGRRNFQPLPPSLVISVTGPGHISVGKGSLTIGKLFGGRTISPSTDVFESCWLRESFDDMQAELFEIHEAAARQSDKPWAELDPYFPNMITQQMGKQLISAIRNSRHGGTLILLPPELAAAFSSENRYMTAKYTFTEEEPRQRFRTLILRFMNALAEEYGGDKNPGRPVGWEDYVASDRRVLSHLEEAVVEVANLIAGLAVVDGAVLLSKRIEMLGFGAEISGALEPVTKVARALDAEGERLEIESTDGVGTRHRSAYRLCNALHDAIAIVISQDRDVRFVKWKDGIVTYWDQVATSVLDV